ncbi:NnrU family protein [Collimonas humicola]|uniref:NnrU family protein n=1 Tax=Collimonas humicola TaxID=2825886 RepID=UPI001B8B1368|nr:NnrU family protein [Collimonas humicola]
MEILILGLLLFIGLHLIPTLPPLKAGLQQSLGENRYKALFAVLAGLGLILVIVGYAKAPAEPRFFNSFVGARHGAPLAMAISFILLAAANMKSHIRAWVKHPMLLGVGIWALVHLLANGHEKATILFSAFLAFVVIDLISVLRRDSYKPFEPALKYDVIAVASGLLLALLVMTFHRQLMGVAVVPWGR